MWAVTASAPTGDEAAAPRASLRDVAREWGRLGCIGFGGPPAHIKLLRDLCVERRRWLGEGDFEDAIAACNLLPGPASTQLAIFCAWRARGRLGAVVGGIAFIVPGLIIVIALTALFLANSPPHWVLGAGAGAGAGVAAVAVRAGTALVPTSWNRRHDTARWLGYATAGAVSAAVLGPWVVVVLMSCGLVELLVEGFRRARDTDHPAGDSSALRSIAAVPLLVSSAVGSGVIASVVWVAFKVGALSYGGGFVIIPLMQSDAVSRYHWMSADQFLNVVALGQITPGPVVQTVAAVGYAAAGIAGALVASAVAFGPSFAFVLLGARRFDALRADPRARAFLAVAGPAAIGAILGSAVPLTRAISQSWQYGVLAGAAVLLLALRRSVVMTLLCAGAAGTIVALAGGPIPH